MGSASNIKINDTSDIGTSSRAFFIKNEGGSVAPPLVKQTLYYEDFEAPFNFLPNARTDYGGVLTTWWVAQNQVPQGLYSAEIQATPGFGIPSYGNDSNWAHMWNDGGFEVKNDATEADISFFAGTPNIGSRQFNVSLTDTQPIANSPLSGTVYQLASYNSTGTSLRSFIIDDVSTPSISDLQGGTWYLAFSFKDLLGLTFGSSPRVDVIQVDVTQSV